jgi:hypothetical protein
MVAINNSNESSCRMCVPWRSSSGYILFPTLQQLAAKFATLPDGTFSSIYVTAIITKTSRLTTKPPIPVSRCNLPGPSRSKSQQGKLIV